MPALLLRALVATAFILCPVLASAQGLRVVARVNDEAITDFDLAQRITFAVKSSGLQDSADIRNRLAPQILRQMIDEKLQVQNAKALGLAPTDSEVGARVAEIERSAGMSAGTFRAYLQSIGVPLKSPRSRSRRQSPGPRSCDARSAPRSMSPTPRSTMR